MRLEGWTANVQFGNDWSTDWADHTWVRSPQNGQFFDCWGGHSGPNARQVVYGDGSYNWANCYRCHIWPFRDTAGIGIYGVDGVCHQTANLFLYSAGRTLNTNVRGYWLSVFTYGVFGRSFWRWLVAPYGTCTWTTSRSLQGMSMAAGDDGSSSGRGDDQESVDEDPIIGIVRDVYQPTFARGRQKHPHELLVEETEKVTQHFAPDVNYEKIRRIQMDYLQKRDDVIARGHKEEQLAKRLDDLARKVQRDLARELGADNYEKLMGVSVDQSLGIIEPALVDAAGIPVPPPEVQMQQSEERGPEADETNEKPDTGKK
jgi:hypothetical protein